MLDLAGFRIDGMYNPHAACSRPPEYPTPKFLSSFGKVSCGGGNGLAGIQNPKLPVDRLCSSTLAPFPLCRLPPRGSQRCNEHCSKGDYAYYGVQWGKECW